LPDRVPLPPVGVAVCAGDATPGAVEPPAGTAAVAWSGVGAAAGAGAPVSVTTLRTWTSKASRLAAVSSGVERADPQPVVIASEIAAAAVKLSVLIAVLLLS
jgi:hypothetical protein